MKARFARRFAIVMVAAAAIAILLRFSGSDVARMAFVEHSADIPTLLVGMSWWAVPAAVLLGAGLALAAVSKRRTKDR